MDQSMCTCAITHQKYIAQSGRSKRSAVDNFNTLCLFIKVPMKEQETKVGVYELIPRNP